MPLRSKESYHIEIYEMARDIWVECPNCGGKAIVDTDGFHALEKSSYTIRLTCGNCGYNKYLDQVIARKDPRQKKGKVLVFGAPIDPFFHLPLWLQAEFEGNIFWAYQMDHLKLLETHVAAKLRERNQQLFNVKSIGARLPRWMTTAKNRDEILKLIRKLKTKI
ncbi:MAG: TFIIB-type zinc ribbon-containing protein [Saprospiraceae bacterium]|nr:TFIIB-type zinc ribbon-containing protein [Saprospiraceae bacterium]